MANTSLLLFWHLIIDDKEGCGKESEGGKNNVSMVYYSAEYSKATISLTYNVRDNCNFLNIT